MAVLRLAATGCVVLFVLFQLLAENPLPRPACAMPGPRVSSLTVKPFETTVAVADGTPVEGSPVRSKKITRCGSTCTSKLCTAVQSFGPVFVIQMTVRPIAPDAGVTVTIVLGPGRPNVMPVLSTTAGS